MCESNNSVREKGFDIEEILQEVFIHEIARGKT
jgi:hypothetical protein